jgi:3-oxoacyl-[acyl-carrier protein] reductase
MLKKIVKKGVLFILHNLPAKKVKAEICVLDSNELLKDRVAFITGGTSGIGFYIASKFLHAGAKVIICGRNESRVESACEKLQAIVETKGDVIKGVVLDVKDVSCFNDKIKEAEECYNRHIDILVNNAGVLGGHISDVSEEEYDNILDTNLKGHFLWHEILQNI